MTRSVHGMPEPTTLSAPLRGGAPPVRRKEGRVSAAASRLPPPLAGRAGVGARCVREPQL